MSALLSITEETICAIRGLMRYGVPYKGSKNQIAEWVYSHFPKRNNFYDLFAGGCAILQVALMRQEYKNYIANDIDDDGIKLFMFE